MAFESTFRYCAPVSVFRAWPETRPGIRVMMMPYLIHDPVGSLPAQLAPWYSALVQASYLALGPLGVKPGVGYLTIDEALVRARETHRRPGLHVDGVGADGTRGGGAYGGGGYAASGMLMTSSHIGCRAYVQDFENEPDADGDCSHLADELEPDSAFALQARQWYWCSPMTVHEAIPMRNDTRRQFCRVSFPSTAPWHIGYTENPLGIMPTGPIHPPRAGMSYRP